MFSVMVMSPVAAICNKVAALSIWELFLNVCHVRFKEPCWVLVRLFSFFFLSGWYWFFSLTPSFLIFLTKQKSLLSSAFIRQCLHQPRPKSFSGAQGASQGAPRHPPTRSTAHALWEAPGRCSSEHQEAVSWSLEDTGRLGGMCVTSQLLGDCPRTEGPRRARGSSLLTWPRKLVRWPTSSREMPKH